MPADLGSGDEPVPGAPRPGGDRSASASPVGLALAAALQAGQGLGLLGLTAFYVVGLGLGRADEARGALITAVLAGLAGLSLLLVAKGLRQRRRWSRAPSLLTQVFLVLLAYQQVKGGLLVVGVPLLAWGVVLLGLLLAPRVGGALED